MDQAPSPTGQVVGSASEPVPDDVERPNPVERTRAARVLVIAGTLAAALGLAMAVLGLEGFFYFAEFGEGWAVTAVVCASSMLLVCAGQLLLWRRAVAFWRGGSRSVPQAVTRPSFVLHIASYPVVLVALLAGIRGSADTAWTTSAAVWLTLSMVLVVAAQVLAAVQYVRTDGPPGTVPTHLRRLTAWIAYQRRRADD